MAMQVPTAFGSGLGQVQARAASQLPNVTQNVNANADAFGGAQAKLLARAADAIGQASNAASEIEKQNAALEAADLDMQAKKEIMNFWYDPDNGALNSRGADALSVSNNFKARMADIKKRYSGMVKSPISQKLLDDSLNKMELTGLETAYRHESAERRAYASSLSGAQIATAIEQTALSYNDDDIFEANLETVRQAAHNQAILDGFKIGDDAYNQRIKDSVSAAYTARLAPMIESDDPQLINRAFKNYESNADKFDLKSRLELDNKFDAVMPKMGAMGAFDSFIQESNINSIPSDLVFERGVLGQESGYKQVGGAGSVAGPDEPTTSTAGAIGIAQVLPSTAKEVAQKSGIAWDEQKFKYDADYNAKIGGIYFAQLRDKYGSTPLALLAYNWGLGNVDEHIAKVGDPRKGEISMSQFIARVPSKEARNYVPNVMKNVSDGRLDEARAMDYAQSLPANQREHFMSMVQKRNESITSAKREQTNAIVDQMQQILQESNGDINLIDPKTRAEAMRLGVWDKALSFKGYTDPDLSLDLSAMSSDELAGVDFNDPSVSLRLSWSDKQEWIKKQNDLSNPDNSRIQKQIDSQVNYWFSALNKGKNPDDKANKSKVSQMRQAVQEQVDILYKRKGEVSPEDISIFSKEYIKSTIRRDGLFGEYETSAQDYTIDMIPEADRVKIENRILARGDTPTETKVINTYFRLSNLKPAEVYGPPAAAPKDNSIVSDTARALGIGF